MWQYYLLGYHFFLGGTISLGRFHQCELTLLEILEETGIRMDYYSTKSGLKAWTGSQPFLAGFYFSFVPLPAYFSPSALSFALWNFV